MIIIKAHCSVYRETLWINAEFFREFCEDVGVGVVGEELLTTSKLLCSTYLKIKGICSMKALKFKYLMYTGENIA